MTRRVAVTGVGVCSSLGNSAQIFWDGCLEGRATVAPIPEHWSRYADNASTVWAPLGPLPEFLGRFSRVERIQIDPVALLGLDAALQALEGARIATERKDLRAGTYQLSELDAVRTGVWMGTGSGGAHSFLHNHTYHLLARPRQRLEALWPHAESPVSDPLDALRDELPHAARFNPFVVSMLMPNALSATLGIKLGLHGPNITLSLACASGTAAIGHAYRALRDGEVDAALAGGSEYLNDEHGAIFHGFDVAHALARDCADGEHANRPFDQARSGFLYAEGGAAVLLLEPLDAARRRGAPIVAEIVGYGESFDAYSIMAVAPDACQIERALRAALDVAGLGPEDVDYLNAHGTGTQVNDEVESAMIARVLGDRVLVNSTKSLIGHTIGASGALEAAVTAFSLRDQRVHGCHNLDRPVRPLHFARTAQAAPLDVALSESFAFGGHNAVLAMQRAPE